MTRLGATSLAKVAITQANMMAYPRATLERKL